MNNRFAVIGLGQFGMSIALTLAERGAEVIAIDKELDKIEQVKEDVAVAVSLDSTDRKALSAQNVQEVDGAVVAIGEDFESLILTTVILQELKVKRIIARAANIQQRLILEKLGVEEILSPEKTVGKSLAEMLLHPSIRSFLNLPDEYEIVEVDVPKRVANFTIADLKLRQEYDLNIVTIKRVFTEVEDGEEKKVKHIIGVPRPDTSLKQSDQLIILGKTDDINRFIESNQ